MDSARSGLPAAGPWLHLGATSAYVTDNADIIVLRDATDLVVRRATGMVAALADFAATYRDLPCLGHTHFQPAQPTTVGKRTCLWLSDLLADLERLEFERSCLLLRGAKGTTSMQASFLQLVGSDEKVRALDDSANRRLVLPEAFLAADALLLLWHAVAPLQLYPAMVRRNLEEELPFMATEEILLAAAARGGDRQELHERLRLLAREAARQVKQEGRTNPLLEPIAADPAFRLDAESLAGLLKPERFVGRAPAQVDEFLAEHVRPWLAIHPPSLPDEEPQV